MLQHEDYEATAKVLATYIDNKAFTTIERSEVTKVLREVSGESRTRIKSLVARDLTEVLEAHGLRFYPSLEVTDTRDNLRLYRVGSVLSQIVDLIAHPSPQSDIELGIALKKVKGTWHWQKRSSDSMELQAVS